MKKWRNYFNKHLGRKPKRQFLVALEFCKNREAALDLGCGVMVETKELSDQGFETIIAIDSAPEIRDMVEIPPRVDFYNIAFQEYEFPPNKFDFINSEYSLPFYGVLGFKPFFEGVLNSLKKGGVFTGQLFGINDSWSRDPSRDMPFFSLEEVKELLKETEVIDLKEVEKDDKTATGEDKHWHIFNFIVRKPIE